MNTTIKEPAIRVNLRDRKTKVRYFRYDQMFLWNFVSSRFEIDDLSPAEYQTVYQQIRRHAAKRRLKNARKLRLITGNLNRENRRI
jgi:hypothetical protein